jgi:hypothetical protein
MTDSNHTVVPLEEWKSFGITLLEKKNPTQNNETSNLPTPFPPVDKTLHLLYIPKPLHPSSFIDLVDGNWYSDTILCSLQDHREAVQVVHSGLLTSKVSQTTFPTVMSLSK